MRTANHSIIIAVVSLAAYAVGWQRGTRSIHNSSEYLDSYDWSTEGDGGSRMLSFRETQMLLRKEGGERGLPVDCCPSTLEMVEPEGGINQEGMLVQLFSEGENRQRFYELSCRQGVADKPCRFMDKRLHNQSRCVQKYSYTYAIVKESLDIKHHHRPNHFTSFPAAGTNWRLDYIRVRSGCSCEVTPKLKRKRTSVIKPSKRGKSRGKDSDEEFLN